jgi:hypothetical protein
MRDPRCRCGRLADVKGDTNPLAGNPLRTRADVQDAARACYRPLLAFVSPAGARVRLGHGGANFDPAAVELEGFARPLWGLAALEAGGGAFEHWDRIRSGLAAGTDPAHPEYWGAMADHDQRLVEAAAIGTALVLAPGQTWDPLEPSARTHLSRWLGGADRVRTHPNNWLFFRVLVDLGLERVGVGFDDAAHRAALDGIDALDQGHGWYRDGPDGLFDWYGAFALHTYGLIYAASGLGDAARAERFRQRSAAYATDLARWFGPDGAAVALGRSMTYRFAQAAFWGALALADVEALPWGQVKGLYLANLRHWATRPVGGRDGVLSIGYGYETQRLAESYNSPGSPYWAMKAFLALAVPEDHPFWLADEEPVPADPGPVVQPVPRFVISRDAEQVLLLTGGQPVPAWIDQGRAKYQRLAYSSRFGFSADVERADGGGTGDSTLWLVDAEGDRRMRGQTTDVAVVGELVVSTWRPWPDVEVDTVVWGAAPWHGRAHRIRSGRQLTAHEFGFALGLAPDAQGGATHRVEAGPGSAVVTSPLGRSGLIDGRGTVRRESVRPGQVRLPPPNVNLEWPATAVPVLVRTVGPGTHDLVTLAFGAGPGGAPTWDHPPVVADQVLALLDQRAPHRSATAARRRGVQHRLEARMQSGRRLAAGARRRWRRLSRRGS